MQIQSEEIQEFLSDWLAPRQSMFEDMIGQMGGEEVFLAEYGKVFTHGCNDKRCKFKDIDDRLSFYNEHKKEIYKFIEETACHLGYENPAEYIHENIKERGISKIEVLRALRVNTQNNQDKAYRAVATWLTYEAFEGFCARYELFVNDNDISDSMYSSFQ